MGGVPYALDSTTRSLHSTYCGSPWECVMLDLTSECRYEIICCLLDSSICRQAGYKTKKIKLNC